MFDISKVEPVSPEPSKCKGLVFRFRSNNYINSRGEYIIERKLSPLKRKSCPGCIDCDGILDALDEDLACNMVLPNLDKLKEEKKYRLNIRTHSYETGWETEYDYDLYLEEFDG